MAAKRRAKKEKKPLTVEELKAKWAELLVEMKANRKGRIPKDRDKESAIADQMTDIFLALPDEERAKLERPESPRTLDRPIDLIALNDKGRLIGYEED